MRRKTGGSKLKNNKTLGLTAWALGLVLNLAFLFFIPKEQTVAVTAVMIFTVVVYLLNLVLWGRLQKGKLDFYNMPALTLSVLFLVAHGVWGLIVSFAAAKISTKTAVFISILLIVLQGLGAVMALIAKNHAQSVNKRQKDHHTEL